MSAHGLNSRDKPSFVHRARKGSSSARWRIWTSREWVCGEAETDRSWESCLVVGGSRAAVRWRGGGRLLGGRRRWSRRWRRGLAGSRSMTVLSVRRLSLWLRRGPSRRALQRKSAGFLGRWRLGRPRIWSERLLFRSVSSAGVLLLSTLPSSPKFKAKYRDDDADAVAYLPSAAHKSA